MLDGLLHVGDESICCGVSVDYGGDESDVVVDVGEGVRCEGEEGEAGFEDSGEGLHTVGDAGDHDVGMDGLDLFGIRGPTIVKDWKVADGERGEYIETVSSAGAEVVETV